MGRPFITEHTHPYEWLKSRQGHRFDAVAHLKSDEKWSIFFEPTGLLLANGLLLNSSNHNSSNHP
jgi:hypothetical protein